MYRLNVIVIVLLLGLMIICGCSKESAVPGKWSRDGDAIVMELSKDKTGTITANNVKIYNKMGVKFPSDIQLVQKIKCKWVLLDGDTLKIEEVDSSSKNTLVLKLAGKTLTKDGKVVFTKI